MTLVVVLYLQEFVNINHGGFEPTIPIRRVQCPIDCSMRNVVIRCVDLPDDILTYCTVPPGVFTIIIHKIDD